MRRSAWLLVLMLGCAPWTQPEDDKPLPLDEVEQRLTELIPALATAQVHTTFGEWRKVDDKWHGEAQVGDARVDVLYRYERGYDEFWAIARLPTAAHPGLRDPDRARELAVECMRKVPGEWVVDDDPADVKKGPWQSNVVFRDGDRGVRVDVDPRGCWHLIETVPREGQ